MAMKSYTFSGPADGITGEGGKARGRTTVMAGCEADARHLAMVARWGRPNGRPCADVDRNGRYLSSGLSLVPASVVLP